MDKLIFISNDDGFEAEGIRQLAEMMRELGDVFVVAPDGGRSGASMSISSHSPVRNTFICHEGERNKRKFDDVGLYGHTERLHQDGIREVAAAPS